MKLMTGLKKKQICAAIAFGLMFTGGGHWEKAEAEAGETLYGATKDISSASEIKDAEVAKPNNTTTHIAKTFTTDSTFPHALKSGAVFTIWKGTWDNVYGGVGRVSGAVENNIITVDGGVYGGVTINYVIVGGEARTGETTAVVDNIVNIGGRGVTVNGNVYGGRVDFGVVPSEAEVSRNKVNINGVTVMGNIYGGSAEGSANKNQVLINDISHRGNYITGGLSSGADANGNSVTIEWGNFDPTNGDGINIYGGFGKNGASNNTVNISGDNFTTLITEIQAIYGGYSSINASYNTVNISGGSFTCSGDKSGTAPDYCGIGGGYAGSGPASNNVVNISGGDFANIVIWGGFADGPVKNNTVNISGGTFFRAAYADSSDVDVHAARGLSESSNNTVNLIGVGGKLNGISHSGDAIVGLGTIYSDSGSGNILNITGTGTTVKNISDVHDDSSIATKFSEINFVITSAMANGATMLTIDGGAATDFSGAVVNVRGEAGANLQAGTTINLVHKKDGGELRVPDAAKNKVVKIYQSGVEAKWATVELKPLDDDDRNDLVLSVGKSVSFAENAEMSANAKNMVETRAAGMAVVNEGMDFVTGQGMGQAKLAAKAATKEGHHSLSPFASVGGGNMRYNSGSHVDSKSWHGTVGLAKEIGDLTVGLAINHGSSSYDSYNAGGVHGSGSSKSTGVTVMAEVSKENGIHYDAALQAGRLKNDYSANLSGYDTRYDESSNYYGLSLGGGKEFAISDKEKVDVYGRYYWSHTNSSDTTTNTGDRLSFDAVNSHRLRLGGRYTRTVNDMSRLYAGLAWQYEFKGDARAVINGQSAPSPSLKGHSAMLELGWKADVAKNLAIDLNVSGWAGKQQGVTGSLGLKWMF